MVRRCGNWRRACSSHSLRAGDDDRVARLVGLVAERVDDLDDAHGSPRGPVAFIQRAPVRRARPASRRGKAASQSRARSETSVRRIGLPSGLICQYQPECVTSNSGS